MILTVTPNTALDRVIFLEGFRWGHTVRAQDAVWSPGGKGTDAAWVLGELGEPCLATGLAAAESGRRLQEMLERQGARCDFVWTGGETRTNYVLVDRAQSTQATVTVSGLQVRAEDVAALEARLERWLPECSVLMLGGSVPAGMSPDWYVPWVRTARGLGVPVLLDASGETLARSAPAGPTLLKPNLDELCELVGRPLATAQEVAQAGRELLDWGIDLIVATLGGRGAVAVTSGNTWLVPPLPVQPLNCAGAGDAMMAGLAIGYARGWPVEEGLRLGAAAAAAVVITPGTAQCHRSDVERLLPQVVLEAM
ncbi:MAG: 1-phosphofructokinase family hexose kinase [Anaerolineae bacterium]|nr:1-phosphofructokinase family hexose kinase [Anaerolineae bacterium]